MLVTNLYRNVVFSQNGAGTLRDWDDRDPRPIDDALGREGIAGDEARGDSHGLPYSIIPPRPVSSPPILPDLVSFRHAIGGVLNW